MAKKQMLPKVLYVYVCDWCDNEPIYSAVPSLDDIPDEQNGKLVAVYRLEKPMTLHVRIDRELV